MSYRIVHISDLHLPPLPMVRFGQVANKRLLGYLSWHRRRKHRHRTEVITALQEDLARRRADHICITGDITNLGLPAEFRSARSWLEQLAPPGDVTFVPGNHDAYVPGSVTAMHEELGVWLPDGYPSTTRREDVLFIGVSSSVPTPLLLATGRVGTDQLLRLETVLDETSTGSLFRVLLIHHPPAKGVVNGRKSLSDSRQLTDLLRAYPVDLVLHGHGHRATRYQLESVNGPIPVFGAGSASLRHAEPHKTGHYHVFDVDDDGFSVQHFEYRPEQRRFRATGEAEWTARRPGEKRSTGKPTMEEV